MILKHPKQVFFEKEIENNYHTQHTKTNQRKPWRCREQNEATKRAFKFCISVSISLKSTSIFFLSYRYLEDAFVLLAHPISALLARDVLPLADSNHFYPPYICYQENVLNMMFCTQKIKHMEGECVTSITIKHGSFTHYCCQICHSETTWSKCTFLG